jgi:hypothetical protein
MTISNEPGYVLPLNGGGQAGSGSGTHSGVDRGEPRVSWNRAPVAAAAERI